MKRRTIGVLAKATGTKVETIRYYERIGLFSEPARSESNYRTYEEEHFGRLHFIRRARGLGFSLGHVRELLELADQRNRPCEAVDRIARQHLAEIEGKIANLEALRDELTDIINHCSQGTVAECHIIDSLKDKPKRLK